MEYPFLPPRTTDSHKGTFGHIGLLGGSPGLSGALLLSGRAALKSGAGLVTLGMLNEDVQIDFNTPELMFTDPGQLVYDTRLDVVAIGPGLGQSRQAFELLEDHLNQTRPLVIDADGLNCLAQRRDLATACAGRTSPTLLTPHPGEAARLLDLTTEDIQKDRVTSAQALAARFRAWVVLKGAGSVICAPNGKYHINETGNPALSAPGMGDVLTGLLAALLARLEPWQALKTAVWLHGQAADDAVAEHVGPEGLTASELIEFIRLRLNRPG